MSEQILVKLAEHDGRLASIEYKIDGNGVPGMAQDLRDVREEVIGFKGFVSGAKWILGFVSITQFINLILGAGQFFGK